MSEETGLTSAEAKALIKKGKVNKVKEKSRNSYLHIIISNTFTYFNAIFAVLSILLIIVGSYKNLTFLPVVIANMVIGIFQQVRSKRVLDQLALLDVTEYTAIRDGKDTKVPSDHLVLGDWIHLESGQQIPADAIVVSGEGGVNESLLTGESDEIEKKAGDELKSGSFLASGSLVAKLIRVGADSYAAQLTSKAKAAEDRQSEMIRDIERIIKTAGILIIPIGGALLWQAVSINGLSFAAGVKSMVAAVTGMIPEGMYLLATVALALSAMRLAQKDVLFHDMRSIETLARVNVICVDKTGTITSNQMNVTETFGSVKETEEERIAAEDILTKYIRTVPDNNITMAAMQNYFQDKGKLDADVVLPFSSKTKYSEIHTEEGIYRLGAPEFLLSKNLLADNQSIIERRTGEGLRVLVLTKEDDNINQPILFVALHNKIRPNAKEIFSDFEKQGVAVKVISGDTPLTVSKVAAEAGIKDAEQYVNAQELDTPEKIKAAVNTYTVFGRVQPEQKKQIVEALRMSKQKVAMTGDGVNDILAMKEADCSIAMGEGSDAARQAAQVVLLDSDFSHMKDIVAEGRQDINNITRSATLFLYKNIFSLLLAVFSIVNAFTYPLKPNQVSLISMFNIGIPAFLLSFEANTKRQKGNFIRLTLKGSLPAAVTSFFAIAAMVIFAHMFRISHSDVSTASAYLLSVVGFLILWKISTPMNMTHACIFVICLIGFILCDLFFYQLFDMRDLSLKAAVLCAVFALAEVTVMRFLTNGLNWLDSKMETRN